MHTQDFVALRTDGRSTRYRRYLDTMPPLVVDCDRAVTALEDLRAFTPRTTWWIRRYRLLAAATLLVGVWGLRWLPWWSITFAIVVAYAIDHAIPEVAADVIQALVAQHPEVRTRLVVAGLIRVDLPLDSPTTPAEWARRAWGSGPGQTDDRPK